MEQPRREQAEYQPQLLQQEVEVVEIEDDNPATVPRKEAEQYLSQITQEMRHSEFFCKDMQAAVNELSRHDVNQYLYVTQTWDHIKDYLKAARDQSEIYIYSKQDSRHRTRDRIQRMTEQLDIFRTHRNRITGLYLMQTPVPRNPDPQQLGHQLSWHMSMLREDVDRLLQMAKGKPLVDRDQAQAAARIAGPS